MTKKEDLIKAIITRSHESRNFPNMNKYTAGVFVDAILDTISKSLRARTPVILQGVGKLDIVEHKAKRAYDISRHEAIMLPRRTVIKFKPCQNMKTL